MEGGSRTGKREERGNNCGPTDRENGQEGVGDQSFGDRIVFEAKQGVFESHNISGKFLRDHRWRARLPVMLIKRERTTLVRNFH